MAHNHSHSHGHGHSHAHSHAVPADHNKAFAFGIGLNLFFVFAEAAFGFFSNSLALLADAGHNLSDVIGLVIAWGAIWLTKRKPSAYFTYGMKRSSILAALFNAIILLIAVGAIVMEAFRRIWYPNTVQPMTVIIVAGIGIVINAATALLFMRDRKSDINIRGAYLHMLADALISVGVVIAGIVIYFTSWNWIDPLLSILISVIIIYGTWDLLRDSVKLTMDAVPGGIDPGLVRQYLAGLEGVAEVHDLHIWAMSTTETALTAHLVIPGAGGGSGSHDARLALIAKDLREKFNIHHPTIQIESGDKDVNCELKPDDVV
jgi:cobalt-zinc-cadmium efflux system protein